MIAAPMASPRVKKRKDAVEQDQGEQRQSGPEDSVLPCFLATLQASRRGACASSHRVRAENSQKHPPSLKDLNPE